MGCGDGSLTYAMAALRPNMKIIGVDKSKRSMNKAREKYKLHNLEFKHGDVSSDLFPPGSIDVIINSFILHIVFPTPAITSGSSATRCGNIFIC